MIDKTVKYVFLHMTYNNLENIPEYQLPEGFWFRFYRPGDENIWAEIEVSSGDLPDKDTALKRFHEDYGGKEKDLEDRMLFILNDKSEPIGTATGFYMSSPISEIITGHLHWVAIKKEYQGLKLSKPLITEAMRLMRKHGHRGAYLGTQTTTWLACKIYLDLGWKPYDKDHDESFKEGWEIVSKAINSTK
jgi:GNAT superfamily N-acetyltransferase